MNARAIRCPRCGSGPWEACTSTYGPFFGVVVPLHRERIVAAEQLKEQAS